jgi:hypothetical protein
MIFRWKQSATHKWDIKISSSTGRWPERRDTKSDITDDLVIFEQFGRPVDLYAPRMGTGFFQTRAYMRSRPHLRPHASHDMPLAATISPGSNPQNQQRNTSVTSFIVNPAIGTFARAAGKVAGRAARRSFSLVSKFFEAIVEARAMMARRQAIGPTAGTVSAQRRRA